MFLQEQIKDIIIIAELQRDFGLVSVDSESGYKKAVSSAAARRIMYHHSLPHLTGLKALFGLKATEGDAGYQEAAESVASAGGLRNQYRDALPHLTELRECNDLKATKGDEDYEV